MQGATELFLGAFVDLHVSIKIPYPMDVIKNMALNFSHSVRAHANTLENFDSELSSKLIYINKNAEKLRYLSYLRDEVERQYQEHAKVCTNPTRCDQNKSYEIALYSIGQQYDDYYEMIGGISTSEKPSMQFFAEGQYFDAFTAIKECIKEARLSIVLIDNYVNADTLAFFPSKEPSIKLRLLTKQKSLNEHFNRAVDVYNKQYSNLQVYASENFHDRFLILDDKTFYHIGSSIKDAGNKVFMFSKIDDPELQGLVRKKLLSEWPSVLD